MTQDNESHLPKYERSKTFLFSAIILIGLNLRPVLAGVGPLLASIQSTICLSNEWAGFLTTLPVFLMGLGALSGRWLRNQLGYWFGIGLGLLAISVACFSRMYSPGSLRLILSAALGGVGISLVQTLLPGLIKAEFRSRAGRVIGIYVTAIMGGAAITASFSPWMQRIWSWSEALAFWGLPAAVSWVIWVILSPKKEKPAHETPSKEGPMNWTRRPRAWTLMIYFGLGTSCYTLVLAWLPPYYQELGWSAEKSGLLLGGVTLMELVAGLIVSAAIEKFSDRRAPLYFVLSFVLLGLSFLILNPVGLWILVCVFLGLGIGALFPISMILTIDHAKNPKSAGDLAAFVQGGGYMLASIMPFVAGYLRSKVGLVQVWPAAVVTVLLMMVMQYRFSPQSYTEE